MVIFILINMFYLKQFYVWCNDPISLLSYVILLCRVKARYFCTDDGSCRIENHETRVRVVAFYLFILDFRLDPSIVLIFSLFYFKLFKMNVFT